MGAPGLLHNFSVAPTPTVLFLPFSFLLQYFTLACHCEAFPNLFGDCGILTLSSLFSLRNPSSRGFLISLPVLLHFLKLLISHLSLSFVFGRGFSPLYISLSPREGTGFLLPAHQLLFS